MTKYPCTNIHLDKIRENARQMKEKCAANGVKLAGVAKGAAGDLKVARAFLEGGIDQLADSRIQNLKKFKEAGFKAEMLLLRLPHPGESEEVIEYADISLNTELKTLKALSEAAKSKNKKHEQKRNRTGWQPGI